MASVKRNGKHIQVNSGESKQKKGNITENAARQERPAQPMVTEKEPPLQRYSAALDTLCGQIIDHVGEVGEIVFGIQREGERLADVHSRLQSLIAAYNGMAALLGADLSGVDVFSLIPAVLHGIVWGGPVMQGRYTVVEAGELERLQKLAAVAETTKAAPPADVPNPPANPWPGIQPVYVPGFDKWPINPQPCYPNPIGDPFPPNPTPYIGDTVPNPFTITCKAMGVATCMNNSTGQASHAPVIRSK